MHGKQKVCLNQGKLRLRIECFALDGSPILHICRYSGFGYIPHSDLIAQDLHLIPACIYVNITADNKRAYSIY